MGAGKTTVGRLLAEELGLGFFNLDEVIERDLGMSIPEIFRGFGEEFFRDVETETLKKVLEDVEKKIIATGGGVVLRDENWEVMKKEGITIYLRTPPQEIYSRVKNETNRPLLQVKDPYKKILELLEERKPLYEKADFIVDTDGLSPEEIADKIIRLLGKVEVVKVR